MLELLSPWSGRRTGDLRAERKDAPRIALVCGQLRPELDGVADYAVRLAEGLADHGLDVDLVEPRRVGQLGAPLSVAAAVRHHDVVHVQHAPTAFDGTGPMHLLPLALRRRVRLATTLHEYAASDPRRLPTTLAGRTSWDAETGRLIVSSSRLVVTNADHERLVRGRFPRTRPVVLPVPPNVEPAGHDRHEARAAVRQRLGLPADAPLLVFFGFVHPVKGVRYLLEALPELRRERPHLHLVVAGGSTSLALPSDEAAEVERELRDHARDLGQEQAVTWTGYRPAAEVSELLTAADAAVLPFPRGVTTKSGALAAAFAHGAPVVATAASPPDPALVADRDVALVARPRDAAAVAEAVRRVLGDASLAKRLRERGLEHAKERSWQRISAEHARLYRDLVRT